MCRRLLFLPLAAFIGFTVGCESGRHSAAGFRLPGDGDIERGKLAFVALGCNRCHEVSGMEVPSLSIQPPLRVALGGEVAHHMTDGYMVTSIIHPSYRLAPLPQEQIAVHGVSRMPHFDDEMTVRQLVDMVAFLQSQYRTRPLTSRGMYY